MSHSQRVLPAAERWGTGLPSMTIQVSDAEQDTVLEFFSGMSVAARHRFAVNDVLAGLRLWRLAWSLGWLDIRLRYRGSMLGPFWLTISTGVMVGSLGFLYAALWHMSVRDYLPFLALSQVLWGFLSTLVSESCAAFTESEGVIRSVRMPLLRVRHAHPGAERAGAGAQYLRDRRGVRVAEDLARRRRAAGDSRRCRCGSSTLWRWRCFWAGFARGFATSCRSSTA